MVLLASLLGYYFPMEIIPFKGMLFLMIALIMLSMGLTLSLTDMVAPFKTPLPLILGIALQFLLMPMLAWGTSKTLNLSNELMIGMVLVGTVPGGTTSNVLTFLAGGRVALSVSMTAVSTLASILLTPLLTAFWLNTVIAVDQIAMLISIVQLVLMPVLGGVFFRTLLPKPVAVISPYIPACAVLALTVAISIVVALNTKTIHSLSGLVVLAILMHNITGLLAGYGIARLAGQDIQTARTIAIEVGTQNTGMAAALAIKHFVIIAALPAALFSISQNLLGAILAGYWTRNKTQRP